MSLFKLQQFSVKQTISGMKICSDSLLFGAMIPVTGCKRILDIGAGTGILSLMLAQKCHDISEKKLDKNKTVSITTVELTPEAATEARVNFANSPWGSHLSLVEQDIQRYSYEHKDKLARQFDLIVCNPPFFADHSKTISSKALRHTARHTDSLSFTDLCQSISQLLAASGHAYLLLPVVALTDFVSIAFDYGRIQVERVDISESERHPVKVAILQFVHSRSLASSMKNDYQLKEHRINKFSDNGRHTGEARALLTPFLLRYG